MKIPRHSQRDEYFVTIVDEVIKIFFCLLILRDLTEIIWWFRIIGIYLQDRNIPQTAELSVRRSDGFAIRR